MAQRYQGGILGVGFNPLQAPNAPTIGTASVASATSASVAFTAPANVGGSAITSYAVQSSPGGIGATGASSPITVSGLTTGTAYTFRVTALNSYGPSPVSASSNSVTPVAQGQQLYSGAGTFSWVAPACVTSVSVVAVGSGAGGGFINGGSGGGLGYKNNISVTPGSSYTVVVGAVKPGTGGIGQCGECSYFSSAAVVRGGGGKGGSTSHSTGGSYTGDGGGSGGTTGGNWSGGGGAGGYAGNGGTAGNNFSTAPTSGAGGGGSGGGSGFYNNTAGGGGGGVGVLGQGANGAPVNNGPYGTSYGWAGASGGGGSGGTNGGNNTSLYNPGGAGGTYGAGGGMAGIYCNCVPCCSYGGVGGASGGGAVRIIWPGTTRSFPSTNTGNL
jgi:hypothetical protein